jgi:hypothetical protein
MTKNVEKLLIMYLLRITYYVLRITHHVVVLLKATFVKLFLSVKKYSDLSILESQGSKDAKMQGLQDKDVRILFSWKNT